MSIKLNRSILKNALDKVMSTVGNNAALPILKGIKITVEENSCVLESTNLTASTVVTIEAQSDAKHSFVVTNAAILYQFIKSLKIEDIEIEVAENSIKISGLGVTTNLPISSADDFPKIDSKKSNVGIEIKVKGEELIKLVNLTSVVTVEDQSRPILKCIHLEYKPEELTGVGLDGYRIGYMVIPTIEDTKENTPENEEERKVECNIPAKEFLSITKNLSSEADVKINIASDFVNITQNKESYIIKTMEGNYINYKQILLGQNKFTTTLLIDINELCDSIALMDIMRNSKVNVITFDIKDKLTLNTNNESGNIEKIISVTKEGEDLVIGFNSNKLDILNAITRNCDTEKIYIQFSGPNSAAIFKPVEKVKLIYLILPVRLDSSNKSNNS